MKILHTADWHIGKVLHKHSLEEEHKMFFDWLLKLIKDEKVDLLLVSGDIFDLSNPAAKDRQLYYNFLSKLIPFNIKIIITGGNHDSIGVINAPGDVLTALDIHVVGGAKENIENELIEVKVDNDIVLIVAAVPFLRDKDLRVNDGSHLQSSRVDAIKAGIKRHYDKLATASIAKYKNIPLIGMGHLYAKGVISSESERDIHIGNAAAVEAGIFSNEYKYLALGHIHRPQVIGKNKFIRYSGSPVALSFSEKEDKKSVLILELNDGQIQQPISVPIPKFRDLKKLSGSLEDVSKDLDRYTNKYPLPSFIELEIHEEVYNTQILVKIEDLINGHKENKLFKVLKSKTSFKIGSKDTSDLFQSGENIEDLKPKEVFLKKLESEQTTPEQKEILLTAFLELMDTVHEMEKS